jgi:hypothetical protein
VIGKAFRSAFLSWQAFLTGILSWWRFLTDISGAAVFRNARLVYLLRLFLFENGGPSALAAI